MKTNSHLHYHTWKDVGGVLGLAMDAVYCLIVLIAAVFSILVGTILVGVTYVLAPLRAIFRSRA